MKKRKQILMGIVYFLLTITFSYFLVTQINVKLKQQSVSEKFISCYQTPSTNLSFPEFKDDPSADKRRKIFFLETSCSISQPAKLNCRQACAIESAANLNPNMLVLLLFISPSPPSESTKKLLKHLLTYENFKVQRVYFEEYLKNTPVDNWFDASIFKNSPWPGMDMSDMLRQLTIWKFGGVYLDLDVILTKSLEDLRNFMVAESQNYVASGMYGLGSDESGRNFSDACLLDMMENFRDYRWGHIGPDLMTRVVKKLCGVENIEDVQSKGCKGITLLPRRSFHPFDFWDWERYFVREKMDETMDRIEKARGVHLWNQFSSTRTLRTEDRVPLTLLAERHCPRTFKNCGLEF